MSNEFQGALSGVRVLDFGRYIAGPYCAALMADMGAEVIRVEKREGSEDRTLIPLSWRDGEPGEGAMYLQMNRNKKGITLDPMHAQARPVVARLIETADVVVANLPHSTLVAMGLDWASIHKINPRTILTTVSAFGKGGPYAERLGFDGVAQAMSGAVYLSGLPGAPVRSYAPWVDFSTASLAAFGTLAALIARGKTGKGQEVEGALLRTATTIMSTGLMEQHVLKLDRTATGNRGQTAGPSDIFQCKDGWITILINGNPLFKRWARLMGEDHWLADPRYASDAARGDNGADLSARTQSWCATRTVAEAIAALEAAKIPAGPVYSPQQMLEDPHARAAGYFADVSYPGVPGRAPVAATPVRLSDTPGTVRHGPPELGQHTEEILGGIGYSAADIAALRAAGAV
jgi:crotonobetainyl-CoA:carnitine CoA-transferase CaiB-like acyl-CoA transferase